MTVKNHRCDELGACQGLGPDQCPDCESFECEVPVFRHRCAAPRPIYPFAPGVIEGAQPTQAFADVDEWFPLSLTKTLKLAAVLAVLGLVAGYLVKRYA